MSDAALPERRGAALEDSAPSDAMNSAAGKTGRGRRADMGSRPAAAAGMEGPHASKAWRSDAIVQSSGVRSPASDISSRKSRAPL